MTDGANAIEGLWRRLLIARPGEPVDAHTYTVWIQGPGYFADLRQPVGIEAQVQASCLSELSVAEARVLARQEGFAGEFVLDGDAAEWLRALDFQPEGTLRDRGRLSREGDLLIEHGLEADYVEHWQRPPADGAQPCAAARLRSAGDGRAAYLVRWGRHFIYARDRGETLAPGGRLSDLLAGADAARAQALVDCEISVGAVTGEGWRIDRSTLPWRAGAMLMGPDAAWQGDALNMSDMDARGLPVTRRLVAEDVRGDFSLAPPPAAQATTAEIHRLQPAAPFRQVPVVDVAAIGGGDAAAEQAVVRQLRDAATQVGFLHVTGHGIAPAVIARMRAAAARFFDLPLDDKMRVWIGQSANHRGYVPEGEEVFAYGGKDKKEAFDLSFDIRPEELAAPRPMLGPNQWPDMDGFREDVMAYYSACFALGRRLLRGFAMAMGRPADAFDHLVTTPPSQLRLIHYPYNAEAVDVQGIGAHTDYECFTMLLATAPGLEVMNSAGEWIDAPPVEGALVVNIGDMMEYWSGGEFVATSHRVRKVAEERYSFPLFFALDYDAAIRPLDADAAAPLIRTGEHLYAQTVQTFRYLKDRAQRGEIEMPEEARPLSSFGQEFRHRRQKLA